MDGQADTWPGGWMGETELHALQCVTPSQWSRNDAVVMHFGLWSAATVAATARASLQMCCSPTNSSADWGRMGCRWVLLCFIFNTKRFCWCFFVRTPPWVPVRQTKGTKHERRNGWVAKSNACEAFDRHHGA
jgi:hypothetical protein